MGVLRALDAETGDLVWEAWNTEEKQARRQAVIDRGHLQDKHAPKAIMGPPVLFAEGLAIFTHVASKRNYGREKSLVAFDGAGGKQKWRVDNVGPGQGAPSLWVHDRVTYIVAASQEGNVTCVRVADGKVMWKLTGKAYNGHSITVAGDYMVINEVGETKKYRSAQLGAYKLTPEGAQHLWTLPPELRNCNATSPRIIYKNRVYVRRADVKPLSNSVLILDLHTGKLLAETEGYPIINGYQIIADDKLYYECDGNHSSTHLVNSYSTDPAGFRRLSQWKMPNNPTNAYEIPMTRPIVKGKMYARGNDGHIYCYDVTAPQADTRK
jgi:outer membrane protein assembly factor BamB